MCLLLRGRGVPHASPYSGGRTDRCPSHEVPLASTPAQLHERRRIV